MGLFSYEFPCSLVFPFLSSPLDSSYHIINSYNWQRFHTNFFRVFSDLRKTKADFGLFYPTEKNARVQALSLLPLIRVRFAHPPSPEGEGSRSKVKPPLKGKAVAPGLSLPLRRHEARDAESRPLFRVRFAHPPSPEGEGSHSKVKPPPQREGSRSGVKSFSQGKLQHKKAAARVV